MTNREFFISISKNESLSDELREFAIAAIEKLDKRNSQRSSKPSKTAIANVPVKAAIVEYLSDKIGVAADIAAACGITTQKASALCRQLVEAGVLTSTEVKVKGKGKVKAYAIAPAADADEGEDAEE